MIDELEKIGTQIQFWTWEHCSKIGKSVFRIAFVMDRWLDKFIYNIVATK